MNLVNQYWKIDGFSIGGVGTNLRLPSHGIQFDIGRCSDFAVSLPVVAVTHGHLDHIGGAHHYASRRQLLGLKPPTFLVSPTMVWPLAQFLASASELDGGEIPFHIKKLAPDEAYTIKPGWMLKPFRSVHRNTCQGYTLWHERKRLLPEYRGLPRTELARLRNQGTSLEEAFAFPEVAYTGDTTIEVFNVSPVTRQVRILVLECTFWDDQVSRADAKRAGHIHVDDIVEIAETGAFQNKLWVLTHPSARYDRAEIEAAAKAKLFPLIEAGKLPPIALGLNPVERGVDNFAGT